MPEIAENREFSFSDEDFTRIVDIVREKTGIILATHKRNMVYSRLARRVRDLELNSFSNYLNFLQHDGGDDEIVNFVNAITTNLTSFFREKHHFDHLKQHMQHLVATNPLNKRLRIWSAASSSGQEPYSIAMTIHDIVKDIAKWDIKILATDIDTNMLEKCKKAEYKIDQIDDIPAEYRNKYTTKMNGHNDIIAISDTIKKMITYNQLNLLGDWPMKGQFDIIFCRNVVIYFDKPTQKELFSKMADILKPGGILYIGHSESLFSISDKFKLVDKTTYIKTYGTL